MAEIPTSDNSLIELIGGPLCGMIVKWPNHEETRKFEHLGGEVTYKLRGERKAWIVKFKELGENHLP